MQYEITFAGFGGQGIMTAGKFLAQGAMNHGLEVAWVPSYGPEMRGGTAYCTVVISSKPVGSPVVKNPGIAVVMNRPSLDKFASQIKPDGVLIINSSLIEVTSEREDILQVQVPCNKMSQQVLGVGRSANIAALGALLGVQEMIPKEEIEKVMETKFGKKPKILKDNLKIFRDAYKLGKKHRKKA
ncbi:MAG: 2-oxoacid:acceptor oxidoreductase family protein [Myxococcota bacterium]